MSPVNQSTFSTTSYPLLHSTQRSSTRFSAVDSLVLNNQSKALEHVRNQKTVDDAACVFKTQVLALDVDAPLGQEVKDALFKDYIKHPMRWSTALGKKRPFWEFLGPVGIVLNEWREDVDYARSVYKKVYEKSFDSPEHAQRRKVLSRVVGLQLVGGEIDPVALYQQEIIDASQKSDQEYQKLVDFLLDYKQHSKLYSQGKRINPILELFPPTQKELKVPTQQSCWDNLMKFTVNLSETLLAKHNPAGYQWMEQALS